MSDTGRDATDDDAAHLDDVPDGLGCAEVWEELSERRGEGSGNGESADGATADEEAADGEAADDEGDEPGDGGDGASTAERNGEE